MVRFKQMALLAGAVGWLWLLGPATPQTEASPIIPRLVNVVPNPDGTFTWQYTASIAADERVQSGPNDTPPGQSRPDFFTIYDIFGFVGVGPTQPPGWVASTALVGLTPDFASPPGGDNPGLPNVTWTYTGAAPILGPNNNIVGAPFFNFISTVSGVNDNGSFAGETTRQGGPEDNTNVYTSGTVAVPIPEPGTLVLALAGPAFLLGAVRRGLRRRQAPEVG